MGEPQRPDGPDASQLAAFRRKLEEFEAMGLDTEPLRRALEQNPQDFDRQAEAFLRRELTGEEALEPAEEPTAAGPAGGEAPLEGAEPAAAPAHAPEPVGGAREEGPPPREVAGGEEPPPAEAARDAGGLEVAAADAPSESATDAPLAAPPQAQGGGPGPAAATAGPPEGLAVSEAPVGGPGTPQAPGGAGGPEPPRDAIEEAMMEELDEAIAEEDRTEKAPVGGLAIPRPPRPPRPRAPTAPPPPPPPLAGGDLLALGAGSAPPPEVSDAPAPAPSPGAGARKPPPPGASSKPPPPGAARPGGAPPRAARPVRVVAKATARAPPLGAKPAAVAAGPGATEVLPARHRARGRVGVAAALALVLLASAALYYFMANAAPVAVVSVGAGPFEAGQLIGFSANGSSDPNGDPLSFSWDFGDGASAIGRYAEHAYARSGNYSVSLTATDREGLSHRAQAPVRVTPGTITPPPYRYGDRLDATVSGTSNIEATGENPPPLGTFTAALPPVETLPRTYNIWGVNLTYSGTQYREVGPRSVTVPDGYLVPHDTYESKRFLDLDLSGIVDNDSPKGEIAYTGESQVTQSDFATLVANDTVRRFSTQHTTVQIEDTNPPTVLESYAQLIEYPDLASAADQLRLESVYVGRAFSTEEPQNGVLRAEGLSWIWETQEVELVAGQLAVSINFTLADRVAGTSFIRLYVKLWVSSASSFPLKEQYFVRSIEPDRTYDSFFESVAVDRGTVGPGAIPFGNTSGSYPRPPASAFAPLGAVPAGGSPPDFAFSPAEAYVAAQSQPDFQSFLASNPDAYTVNGSYGLQAGNPRWLLDFDQNGTGETMRVDVERAGTSQSVKTGPGQDDADLAAAHIGSVVSLDFAASALEDEEQAAALFPGGVLTSIRANFTLRTSLSIPSLSFNAASAATRSDIAYAFGVESRPEEQSRVSAYVDATTGQIAFSLSESGDALP